MTIELLSPFTDAGYEHQRCPHGEMIFADNCAACLRRMYGELFAEVRRLQAELTAERDGWADTAASMGWTPPSAEWLSRIDAATKELGDSREEMRHERDAAQKALAESQAREQALRGALMAAASGLTGYGVTHKEVVAIRAALASPADDSALREFGLKVAQRTVESCSGVRAHRFHGNPAAIVDAVLRGSGR